MVSTMSVDSSDTTCPYRRVDLNEAKATSVFGTFEIWRQTSRMSVLRGGPDALVHDNSEISVLVSLHALIGRMRILSSDAVIERAEAVARMIVDTYFAPNKTFPELRQLMASHVTDPLKEFSLTCRKKLSALGRS